MQFDISDLGPCLCLEGVFFLAFHFYFKEGQIINAVIAPILI